MITVNGTCVRRRILSRVIVTGFTILKLRSTGTGVVGEPPPITNLATLPHLFQESVEGGEGCYGRAGTGSEARVGLGARGAAWRTAVTGMPMILALLLPIHLPPTVAACAVDVIPIAAPPPTPPLPLAPTTATPRGSDGWTMQRRSCLLAAVRGGHWRRCRIHLSASLKVRVDVKAELVLRL